VAHYSKAWLGNASAAPIEVLCFTFIVHGVFSVIEYWLPLKQAVEK
jgi:hypothetical protein